MSIYVKNLVGMSLKLDVEPTDTIKAIKNMILL
jgi:hypothetical protein